MASNNKKKQKLNLLTILLCAFGAPLGYLGAMSADRLDYGFVALPLFFLVCYIIQTIIHEGGHLICGLKSGYQFTSFRIFSRMWMMQDGKIVSKKFSLAGTAGQCLLAPPQCRPEEMPYLLYMMGGVLVNGASAIVAGLLALLIPQSYVSAFFIMLAIVGMMFVILNGIPMKTEQICNDGYNCKELKKSPEVRKALWMQLYVNSLLSQGMRLKDMDPSLFEMPTIQQMKDSNIAYKAALYCGRLLDEGKFELCKKTMEDVLNKETGLLGLHRQLMLCDLVYCNYLLKKDMNKIDNLMEEIGKELFASMKDYPPVIRTQIVYYSFHKSWDQVEQFKARFDAVEKTHPYAGEYQSEKELVNRIYKFKEITSFKK